jgi:hypothetical protein
MAMELIAIRPSILSLVRNPANRKWFYVKKEEGMDEFEKEIREAFPLDDEVESTFTDCEKASEVSDDAKEAIKNALRVLSKWVDDLPSEVKKAVAVLARAAGYGESYGEAGDEDKTMEVEVDTAALEAKLDEISKGLATLLSGGAKKEEGELTLEDALAAEKLGLLTLIESMKSEEPEVEVEEDPEDDSEDELFTDEQKQAIAQAVKEAVQETIEEGSD